MRETGEHKSNNVGSTPDNTVIYGRWNEGTQTDLYHTHTTVWVDSFSKRWFREFVGTAQPVKPIGNAGKHLEHLVVGFTSGLGDLGGQLESEGLPHCIGLLVLGPCIVDVGSKRLYLVGGLVSVQGALVFVVMDNGSIKGDARALGVLYDADGLVEGGANSKLEEDVGIQARHIAENHIGVNEFFYDTGLDDLGTTGGRGIWLETGSFNGGDEQGVEDVCKVARSVGVAIGHGRRASDGHNDKACGFFVRFGVGHDFLPAIKGNISNAASIRYPGRYAREFLSFKFGDVVLFWIRRFGGNDKVVCRTVRTCWTFWTWWTLWT